MKLQIKGTKPILMHNARLSDPLDPAAKAMKAVNGKKSKTEADHEEVARLEHAGSLYIDSDLGPYIPGNNLWRSLYDGAKKHKLGVKVKEGLIVVDDVCPIFYDGPRDADGLFKDKNFVHRSSVKVQMSRVMRTRPVFQTWVTEADIQIDPNVLDVDDLKRIVSTAGTLIGLGDWRPRFGTYEGTVIA